MSRSVMFSPACLRPVRNKTIFLAPTTDTIPVVKVPFLPFSSTWSHSSLFVVVSKQLPLSGLFHPFVMVSVPPPTISRRA